MITGHSLTRKYQPVNMSWFSMELQTLLWFETDLTEDAIFSRWITVLLKDIARWDSWWLWGIIEDKISPHFCFYECKRCIIGPEAQIVHYIAILDFFWPIQSQRTTLKRQLQFTTCISSAYKSFIASIAITKTKKFLSWTKLLSISKSWHLRLQISSTSSRGSKDKLLTFLECKG